MFEKRSDVSLFFSASGSDQHNEDQHMFKDFDYICPELAARLESSSTELLPEQMQDLRIRGYGD